ncbi:hypothetical protein [uncultured Nonlabens sp.]|uniref:hypothetical protein n=1 Tax=uncultured Nonlabens sp. TaxID=859306 RepID=UPI002613E7AE|nr:hypothetical protein [uncultured Nonlabens sp.]
MKNKRYFNRFTTGFTLLIIIGLIIMFVSKISKQILVSYDLIILENTNQKKTLLNIFIGEIEPDKPLAETILQTIFTILVIYSIICFYRFMIGSNKGMLFSSYSFRLWRQIAIIYLVISIIILLLNLSGLTKLAFVIIYGLISAIAYSFSKIFKDVNLLKQENDLTI